MVIVKLWLWRVMEVVMEVIMKVMKVLKNVLKSCSVPKRPKPIL